MRKKAPRFEPVLNSGAIGLLPLLVLACGSSGDAPQTTLSIEQPSGGQGTAA